MMLRSNILGLLTQCANQIELRDGGGAHALREFADNLETVARNPSLWPTFAERYCLTPEDLARRDGA